MRPPIFAQNLSGTIAQQYLHRARMFRDAAISLPDYLDREQYWPKYVLLTLARCCRHWAALDVRS
jgi:hypothetical protein